MGEGLAGGTEENHMNKTTGRPKPTKSEFGAFQDGLIPFETICKWTTPWHRCISLWREHTLVNTIFVWNRRGKTAGTQCVFWNWSMMRTLRYMASCEGKITPGQVIWEEKRNKVGLSNQLQIGIRLCIRQKLHSTWQPSLYVGTWVNGCKGIRHNNLHSILHVIVRRMDNWMWIKCHTQWLISGYSLQHHLCRKTRRGNTITPLQNIYPDFHPG